MASELNEIELEDGEIDELEDGEIADDEEPELPPPSSPKDDHIGPHRPSPPNKFHNSQRNYHNSRSSRDAVGTTREDVGIDFMPSFIRPVYHRIEQDRTEWGRAMRVRPSFHVPPATRGNERGNYGGRWNRNNPQRSSPPQQRQKALSPSLPQQWQQSHVPSDPFPRSLSQPSPRPLSQPSLRATNHPSPRQKVLSPPKERDQPNKETTTDDFDLLLERHKLIQQQLEALERQEQAALDEEEIIDDSFVDIPVEDLETNKTNSQNNNDRSLEEHLEEENDLMNNNDIDITTRQLSNSPGVDEEKPLPAAFAPFKIRPLRPPVPSLKELSNRKNNVNVQSDENSAVNTSVPRNLRTVNQTQPKRKRRRVRKRKQKERIGRGVITVPTQRGTHGIAIPDQRSTQGGTQESVPVQNAQSTVDIHSELEERLLTLAVTPLDEINGASTSNQRDEVESRQKKRRERLKQWQKSHTEPDDKGAGRRKGTDDAYDQDDYLETPMDVESDTADGPVLPLIEEASSDLPPPPPPPPGDTELQRLQDQQSIAMAPNLYGFYPPGQLMYSDWPLGGTYNQQQLSDEYNNARTQGLDPEDHSVPSVQPPQNNDPEEAEAPSDDDDEASMLREILLKSVAKKRAAKSSTNANKEESAPASPSQNTAQDSSSKEKIPSTRSVKPEASQVNYKTTRKPMTYTAPQHSPLVIQLGADSDDSDDEYDAQPHHKVSGAFGFFGNLDQMIKQARESVEASKVKPDETSDQADLPTCVVPKTPDALQHLSEERKAEYRLLKEQLAQCEGKRRQPLTDVNQDKEVNSGEVSSEEKSATAVEESHELVKLREKAVNSEQKLTSHRQVLDSDRILLAKLTNMLTKKTSLLESQEKRISQLKAQLAATETSAAGSRNIVKRLHAKATIVKDRITKKLVTIRDGEEEFLRAKSLVSAAQRYPGLYTSGLSGEENRSMEGDNTIGPAKRGNEEAMGSPKNTKRVKIESPKNTKKQAIAERIALEKTRLKILEKQLADKLRDYNRTSDGELSSNSIAESSEVVDRGNHTPDSKHQHKEGVTHESQAVDRGNDTPDSKHNPKEGVIDNMTKGTPENATIPVQQEAMETDSSVKSEGNMEVRKGKDPDTFIIREKQLAYVNKLQDEKEKKGLVFPYEVTETPQPLHRKAVLCVCPGQEMLPADQSIRYNDLDWLVEKTAEKTVQKDKEVEISVPLTQYNSVLLYYKSYRLSPYFRTKSSLSLSSLSFSNKISPRTLLCKYDIQGVCNDKDCPYQHIADYKLTEIETLQDLAAYISEDKRREALDKLEGKVQILVESFVKQYEGKMSWDELYVLLVNRVKYIRKQGAPYNISLGTRVVRPRQDRKNIAAPTDEVIDRGTGVLHIRGRDSITTHGTTTMGAANTQIECQEIRYFSEAYNCLDTLTAAIKETPSDVGLWIRLAQLKLIQKSPLTPSKGETSASCKEEDVDQKKEERKANLMQALDTLSRGLEVNSNSEELWLEYLHLFAQQGSQGEHQELCEQALEFVPSAYSIWCHYQDTVKTYHDKRSVSIRLITHLTQYEQLTDLHSHRMLESVLYLVQLELYTGHFKAALAVLQAALGKHKSDDEMSKLTIHLRPDVLCLMWLAYIHVFEFHRLPQSWYDYNYGAPARMVSQNLFVFPWQPGKGTRSSSEKLLGMFHDALRACTVCKKKASDKVSLCLPLYRNLLSLEMAHSRHDSAKGICRRLLQGTPAVTELWLCLAALEGTTGNPQKAGEVFQEAMKKMHFHAKIAYSAARFYIDQGNTSSAVDVLVLSIKAKYRSQDTSPPCSLAESTDGTVDPVLLYRKLLSQPLPYDNKTPPLMPGIASDALGEEELYIWLCYCLLLELSPSVSPLSQQYNLSAGPAYETAVHSMVNRSEAQTLWLEYLFYMIDRTESRKTADGLKALDDLVNRCLVSISTVTPLPFSTANIWKDFSFHNQVVNLYMSCLPRDCRSQVYSKYIKWFPGNLHLTLKACAHYITTGNPEQAKKTAVQYLAENPACITMWQILISLELKRNHVKEARKMYQQVTDVLPFAATLWKDYLMFDVARSKDPAAINKIMKRCGEIGLDLQDYLDTLLGKQ